MATQKQARKILAEKTAKAGLMEDKACRRHVRCACQQLGVRHVPVAAWVKCYISFTGTRKMHRKGFYCICSRRQLAHCRPGRVPRHVCSWRKLPRHPDAATMTARRSWEARHKPECGR